MSSHTELDVIIIGAGAAGIGAGLAARSAGLRFVIVEAAGRIGGRAHTVRHQGLAYDLGCHYLHHASHNPFTLHALQMGKRIDFDNEDHEDVPPTIFLHGVRLDAEQAQEIAAYYQASDEILYGSSEDRPLADLLPDAPETSAALYRGWLASNYGVPPERLSPVEAQRQQDVDEDWTIRSGYGDLIVGLADGLPIRTGCPAQTIDRTGRFVRVQTPQGDLKAKAAVVTVSTNVLRSGAIRFLPALPDDVQIALARVPLGYAERIALITDGPVSASEVFAHVLPRAGHAMLLTIQEAGTPTLGGYVAGDLAFALAKEGDAALIDYTEQAAVEILGSDVRRRIVDRITSRWSTNPLIQGGYSASLPGHSDARDVLVEPFDERLVFAGEACATEHYGTAHGAYISGVQAIRALYDR
ncbi:MAG: NAD(P)/FAD-dependent oxidoreductase [Myxococcota bacterium]